MPWGWRVKGNREYSLKGCHKPTVVIDGDPPCTGSVAPSDLSVFPHDPGNNWWKSQLLRVLPERGLRSNKAAQVLPAQGIHHLLPWGLPDKATGRGCLVGLWKV